MAKIKEAIEDFKPDSRLVGMGTTRAEEALTGTASGGVTTGDQRPMLRPGEFLALKYMGDCKCGDCQLVPASALRQWERVIRELELALACALPVITDHMLGGRRAISKEDSRKTHKICAEVLYSPQLRPKG
jgi:hypothetical protein